MTSQAKRVYANEVQKVFAIHGAELSIAEVETVMKALHHANPMCLECFNKNAAELERCAACDNSCYYCRAKLVCKKAHSVVCGK